jgi:hypothetical protein
MKIKYTRGDQEIRPEWSDIYINLGRPTCDQSRKVAIVVATCDCGRRLLSGNKRKGVKSGCALLFHTVYCSENNGRVGEQ